MHDNRTNQKTLTALQHYMITSIPQSCVLVS